MTGEVERIAAEVERLEGPSREMDAEITTSLGIPPLYKVRGSITSTWPDYTASLDAAMTLVPEGWCKTVADYFVEGDARGPFYADCGDLPAIKRGDPDPVIVEAYAATPAIALVAAALKARAHLEQHHAKD